MGFLIQLVIQLVIMALQPVPKNRNAKRYGLNEFDVPSATEDRAWSYGAGTFQVSGNVLWFGDYSARAVTRRMKVNLIKSTKQTIGYEYSCGLWMSLCAATCDELTEVRLGNRVLWAGSLPLSKTATTELVINQAWTTSEGQEMGEGVAGKLIFFNHHVEEGEDFEPLNNWYMESQLGVGNVPSYPGTLHAVWVGPSAGVSSTGKQLGWLSIGPNIEPLRFTLRRGPRSLPRYQAESDGAGGTVSVFYPSETQPLLANGDARISDVMNEILGGRIPGLGPRISPWALDLPRSSDDHGVSFAWELSKPLSEMVSQLCDVACCQLDIDERTGRVVARPFGQALMGTGVATFVFDDTNTIEVESRVLDVREDAANQVVVPWVDRARGWTARQAYANNRALQRAAGGVIQTTVEYLGVANERTATMLASRFARNLGGSRLRFRARAHLGGSAYNAQGLYDVKRRFPRICDKVRLLDPVTRENVTGIITSSQIAGFDNSLAVLFECWAGDWSEGFATEVDVPIPETPDTSPPVALVEPVAVRAPYALHRDDADHVLYYGVDPGTSTNSYRATFQENRTSWSDTEQPGYLDEDLEPAVTGTLVSDLGAASTDTSFVLQLSAAHGSQWRTFTRGQVLMIAGNEWLSASTWSYDATTHQLSAAGVHRGIYDSVPEAHAAGDSIVLLLGYAVDPSRLKTTTLSGAFFDGLDNVLVRAECRGAGGVLAPNDADASEAALLDATSDYRSFRPLCPAAVQLEGVLACLAETGVSAVTRAASVTLSWANRNRTVADTASWFTASSSQESGQDTAYRFAYKDDLGAWVEGGVTVAAFGVNSASIDLTGVPAGERLVRVRMTAQRPGENGLREVVAYWSLSA